MKCKQFAALGLCLALLLTGASATRQQQGQTQPQGGKLLTFHSMRLLSVELCLIIAEEKRRFH